ncbi:V-type ATPase 116kDa subunit family protein [Solemya velesiana gill symbiont]|nr:V-type ATPase 116kDa subunit family protein [Solemya velesiana gill symbiont]
MMKNFRKRTPMLRPAQSKWFEAYVPRGETVYAVEALARTGEVQLELDPRLMAPLDVYETQQAIQAFDNFCKKNRIPPPTDFQTPSHLSGSTAETAHEALSYLEQWLAESNSLEQRKETVESEILNLNLLIEYLDAIECSDQEMERFHHSTDFLYKGVFVCPIAHPMSHTINNASPASIVSDKHEFFLVASLPQQEHLIRLAADYSECVQLTMPDWLPKKCPDKKALITTKLKHLVRKNVHLEEEIQRHQWDKRMKESFANIEIMRWFLQYLPKVATEKKFCHITGWTTAEQTDKLQHILDRSHIHSIVRFPVPPINAIPPVSVLQSWWTRPFRIFSNMLPPPDSNEVDPNLLLPFVVPLLFGFMFPDIGHGSVVILLGLVLARRWPQTTVLLPCGLVAILFGVLFGEAFGFHDIFPTLWFRSIEHPLMILSLSLVIGCIIILVGLVFSGIEAYWRNSLRAWVLEDAALLCLYLLTLIAIYEPRAVLLMIPALVWYLVGSIVVLGSIRANTVSQVMGRLLHSVFKLGVNTLSFLRIGAFALGHAALSAAVIAVASSADSMIIYYIILVAGQVFIIAMAGLVVFIQTTRLIFFEFFTQFLRSDGRIFQPLLPPSSPPSDTNAVRSAT